jgi:hypothetical protein
MLLVCPGQFPARGVTTNMTLTRFLLEREYNVKERCSIYFHAYVVPPGAWEFPAKAGIQNELGWMPDQVRHDIISVWLPE